MKYADRNLTSAVIVCSDSVSQGQAKDSSGLLLVERLKQFGVNTAVYEIIPDEKDIIRSKAESLVNANIDLILFTGGTGFSPRDVTPEAIAPLIETPVPGIMEVFRQYGQERMPYAMFSRGVAGFIKKSLIITLPGSANAVNEAIDALFPQLLHAFKVREGSRHS
jgi:molybdenum cofactor synthesis domain-containing protein